MAHFGAPYRAPAGGWPEAPHRGQCYYHRKSAEEHIQRILNTTKVGDVACVPATPMDPYYRVFLNPGSCRSDCAYTPCTGNLPCAPWRQGRPLAPDTIQSCGDTRVDFNCFQSVADYIDMARCRQFGFKAVQARKVWHGRFGFANTDGISIDVPPVDRGTGCNYEPYHPDPDQTKYLKCRNSHDHQADSVSESDGTPGPSGTATSHCEITVDRYSGIPSVTSKDATGTAGDGITGLTAYSGIKCGFTVAMVNDALLGVISTFGSLITSGWTTSSASASATSYSWHITGPLGEHASVDADFEAGTFATSMDNAPYSPSTTDIAWDDTSYTWVHFEQAVSGGYIFSTTDTWTGALSVTYTGAMVWSDMVGLLNQWKLDDNLQLPFRVDPFYGFAPLVIYDEKPAPQSPDLCVPFSVDDRRNPINDGGGNAPGYTPGTDAYCGEACAPVAAVSGSCNPSWTATYDQIDWFDPDSHIWTYDTPHVDDGMACKPATDLVALYSGNIYGAPLAAGTQGFFCWDHVTVKCCENPGIGPDNYGWAVGAWSGKQWPEKLKVSAAHDNGDGTVSITTTTGSLSGLLKAGEGVVPAHLPLVGGGATTNVTAVTDSSHFKIAGALTGPYSGTEGEVILLGGRGSVDPTDGFMPPTATNWTENYSDSSLWNWANGGGSNPWGAWIRHKDGVCYAQKWAETKIHRPAMNFFRPAGPDRFALKESLVGCATPVDSANLTTEPSLGTLSNTHCLIAGVAGIQQGVYKLNGSGGSYSIGSLIQPVRHLPPGMLVGTGICGVLRWYSEPGAHSAAWSIEGKIKVSKFEDNHDGTYTVTLASPARYLNGRGSLGASTPGDDLFYVDATETFRGGAEAIEVMDDTHFKVVLAGSVPVDDGNWYVKSNGAPGAWWFDNDSKGDYLVLTHLHNFRDIGEADRVCQQDCACEGNSDCAEGGTCADLPGGVSCLSPTDCTQGAGLRTLQSSHGMPRSVSSFTVAADSQSFDPCNPQVVCFTPNGETFTHGKTYWFSGGGSVGPALDDRYGSLWQLSVEFWMADPFWAPPHNLCVDCGDAGDSPAKHFSVCGYEEANPLVNSSCPSDTCTADCSGLLGGAEPGTRYYPIRPYVEARLSVPAAWNGDSAPSLPSDVLINVLSLAALDSADPGSGVVIPPPIGPAYTGCPDIPLPQVVSDYHVPWVIAAAEYCCQCGDPAAKYNTPIPGCGCTTGPGGFAETYSAEDAAECP